MNYIFNSQWWQVKYRISCLQDINFALRTKAAAKTDALNLKMGFAGLLAPKILIDSKTKQFISTK